MSATNLYRHYDAEGKLLYVGISLSAVKRLSEHMKEACWADKIVKVEIETFETREKALDAETNAIQTESPTHNIKKRKKPFLITEKFERQIKYLSDVVNETYNNISSEYNGIWLFRINDAAEILDTDKQTIKAMIQTGEIKPVFVGKTARVPAYEINRILMGIPQRRSVRLLNETR
jgi:excisionase family DNA binding protein